MFGARPLRRLIQSEVQNKLATALLAGGVHDGDTVRVDVAVDGAGLVLTSTAPEPDVDQDPDDDVIEAELLDD
jgi:ATP-dependent Clp protease ATP-binding subunit ClpB